MTVCIFSRLASLVSRGEVASLLLLFVILPYKLMKE